MKIVSYPQLEKEASEISKSILKSINEKAQKLPDEGMPSYKAQYLLELVIKELKKAV